MYPDCIIPVLGISSPYALLVGTHTAYLASIGFYEIVKQNISLYYVPAPYCLVVDCYAKVGRRFYYYVECVHASGNG